MTIDEIRRQLKKLSNPASIAGKSHWNITRKAQWGITIPELRSLAKKIGKNHAIADKLWKTGVHEARILAGMIDDPLKVTAVQMDRWVRQFDSWDVCDQVCSNLFDKTKYSYKKIVQWVGDEREFVRRAGFTMIACLAVHDKEMTDAAFIALLPLIEQYATDDRNFVKKAVNWALRQIGKRNLALNAAAIVAAEHLLTIDSPAARWIARDALRELKSKSVKKRLKGKVRESKNK